MTSPQGCDGCQDEIDLFAVSNRDTGHAQFLGPLCLAMFGATMLIGTSTEVADAAFKGLGYQPTAATKKARKDAEEPDYDPNRVIAEVVADKPEPPVDESTSGQGDESADQHVDNSTDAETIFGGPCPECGITVADIALEEHFRSQHRDVPPY